MNNSRPNFLITVVFSIFGKAKTTWDDAKKACEAKGQTLAQPRDRVELKEISDLAVAYCKESANAPTCKVNNSKLPKQSEA